MLYNDKEYPYHLERALPMRQPTSAPTAAPAPVAPTGLARRLWQGTATRYTVISLCVILLNLLLNAAEAETYVEPLRFLLFLPFSLALTVAALVRRSDKLSGGAKVGLHPLISLGAFYLCLYLPYQLETRPSGAQVLILVILAALVYGIAMGVYLLCTRRARQKKLDETPYVSQFGKK